MPQRRAETLQVCQASTPNTLAGIRGKTLSRSFTHPLQPALCRESRTTSQLPPVKSSAPHSLHAKFQASHPIHPAFPTTTTNSITCLKQASRPEGNLGVLRWCALPLPLPQFCCSLPCTSNSRAPGRSLDHTPAAGACVGRLAEGEDTVIFARVDEAEKCEFIKANAPEDAWASTDDGAYLLIKASALREQAREMLVSTCAPEPPHSRSQSWAFGSTATCTSVRLAALSCRHRRSRGTF